MECRRIIPRLDIKGPNLVKGIHLEGLRIIGKPEKFAEYYYEQGADELMFVDTVASLYGRNSIHDIIKKVAKHIHIPLLVGGGIRTIKDITETLRVGADRVSINTAAIQNPRFIEEAVKTFGSSTIVVTIEAIQQSNGDFYVFTDNGREPTGLEVKKWTQILNDLGVGEIVLTSVDKEGTGQGYDLNLIKQVSEIAKMSVIASGGAGSCDDILNLFNKTNVIGASVAAMLHYKVAKDFFNAQDDYAEGNTDFINRLGSTNMFKTATISELKHKLHSEAIHVRLH
jgi:cyclase